MNDKSPAGLTSGLRLSEGFAVVLAEFGSNAQHSLNDRARGCTCKDCSCPNDGRAN